MKIFLVWVAIVSAVMASSFLGLAILVAQESRQPVEFLRAEISVVPVGLLTVGIIPPIGTVDVGSSMSFEAVCGYDDGRVEVCNDLVTWVSSNPDVGRIDPDTGVVTGLFPGDVVIRASFGVD